MERVNCMNWGIIVTDFMMPEFLIHHGFLDRKVLGYLWRILCVHVPLCNFPRMSYSWLRAGCGHGTCCPMSFSGSSVVKWRALWKTGCWTGSGCSLKVYFPVLEDGSFYLVVTYKVLGRAHVSPFTPSSKLSACRLPQFLHKNLCQCTHFYPSIIYLFIQTSVHLSLHF